MAQSLRDNFHSRVVIWLKVVLPLAALAILSTMFLFSRTIDPSDAIPYADVDVADRLREPRVTSPAYAGVTQDGSMLTVSAAEAKPGAGTGASAKGVAAELSAPDHSVTKLVADAGALDESNKRLTLTGGVAVETSTGYRITTDTVTVALDRTGLESQGSVNATGPVGQITADRMSVTQSPDDPAAYVLVFNGAVKLIYEPVK